MEDMRKTKLLPRKRRMKEKVVWKRTWGVSIFEGKTKVDEKTFLTEKDMAYWLYKNEPNL